MNENAERIKAAVSMDELLDTYGIEVNRGGFVRCPFHNEKTPSLKIYPGDRGYHCFGCNQSGDVIAFVQHYFDMDFKAAIAKLDYDFNIGLPLSKPLSAHQRAEARRNSRGGLEKKKRYRQRKRHRTIDIGGSLTSGYGVTKTAVFLPPGQWVRNLDRCLWKH